MDHHPRGFIQHDTVLIFVKDIQGKRFGHQARVLEGQQVNLDQIAGLEADSRFSLAAIHRDLSFSNHPLHR
jgi:hypothetical protein